MPPKTIQADIDEKLKAQAASALKAKGLSLNAFL
jgi:antitoxin component of RelBE/YafQ-DinJ toxin-antitoxin module